MTTHQLENCDEITPDIYLGGIAAALQSQELVDHGIQAVVCCVRETEFPSCDFHKDLAYYRVDVEDFAREPIELYWVEAVEFMHECISKNWKVFVHCRAGVSRSASTVIAYLVAHGGYNLLDAFQLARRQRAVVTPNLGFMRKLCQYETEVRPVPASTVAFDKYESWYTGENMCAKPDLASEAGLNELAAKVANAKKRLEDRTLSEICEGVSLTMTPSTSAGTLLFENSDA